MTKSIAVVGELMQCLLHAISESQTGVIPPTLAFACWDRRSATVCFALHKAAPYKAALKTCFLTHSKETLTHSLVLP